MAIDRKEVFGASFEQLKHRVKMRYGEDVTPGDYVYPIAANQLLRQLQ
jgi:hypothetical protein